MIYLTGSLRNPRVPEVAKELRQAGFTVWDDWYAAGPEADDHWQRYEQARGRHYVEALDGDNAWHVFDYDLAHLRRATAGLLLLPAGKSSYAEMGYLRGQGKPVVALVEAEPERWDVMLRFATDVVTTVKDAIEAFSRRGERQRE